MDTDVKSETTEEGSASEKLELHYFPLKDAVGGYFFSNRPLLLGEIVNLTLTVIAQTCWTLEVTDTLEMPENDDVTGLESSFIPFGVTSADWRYLAVRDLPKDPTGSEETIQPGDGKPEEFWKLIPPVDTASLIGRSFSNGDGVRVKLNQANKNGRRRVMFSVNKHFVEALKLSIPCSVQYPLFLVIRALNGSKQVAIQDAETVSAETTRSTTPQPPDQASQSTTNNLSPPVPWYDRLLKHRHQLEDPTFLAGSQGTCSNYVGETVEPGSVAAIGTKSPQDDSYSNRPLQQPEAFRPHRFHMNGPSAADLQNKQHDSMNDYQITNGHSASANASGNVRLDDSFYVATEDKQDERSIPFKGANGRSKRNVETGDSGLPSMRLIASRREYMRQLGIGQSASEEEEKQPEVQLDEKPSGHAAGSANQSSYRSRCRIPGSVSACKPPAQQTSLTSTAALSRASSEFLQPIKSADATSTARATNVNDGNAAVCEKTGSLIDASTIYSMNADEGAAKKKEHHCSCCPRECAICTELKILNQALDPCGHVAFCQLCIGVLMKKPVNSRRCPLCAAPINKTLTVYYP